MKRLWVAALLLAAVTPVGAADDPHARFEAATALLEAESADQGRAALLALLSDLESELAEEPTFDLLMVYGKSAFHLEKDAVAHAAFSRASELSPGAAEPQFFLGLLAMFGGDLGEASRRFAAAEKLDPTDSRFPVEAGRVLAMSGRGEEALAAFERANAIEPEDAEAWLQRGVILLGLGRHEDAEAALRRTIAVAPTSSTAHYNLGQMLQDLGRHEESLRAFQRVTELEPADWRARTKVIQEAQASGRAEVRDAARRDLIQLLRQGAFPELAEQGFFCREQFELGEHDVYVLEHWDLIGERPIRYAFRRVERESGGDVDRVSLGSDDVIATIMAELGSVEEGERGFHLDYQGQDGAHQTLGVFTSEPTYDEIRPLALEALKGEAAVLSSFTSAGGEVDPGDKAP